MIKITTPDSKRELTEDEITLLRKQLYPWAKDEEFKLFCLDIERTGLDPFARQIYLLRRRYQSHETGKLEYKAYTYTGIEGANAVAIDAGLDGMEPPQFCGKDGVWVDVWLREQPPAACRVTLWRKGFSHPIVAICHWEEYARYNGSGDHKVLKPLWGRLPVHMILKCTKMQGYRMIGPRQLSNVYIEEEFDEGELEYAPRISADGSIELVKIITSDREQISIQNSIEFKEAYDRLGEKARALRVFLTTAHSYEAGKMIEAQKEENWQEAMHWLKEIDANLDKYKTTPLKVIDGDKSPAIKRAGRPKKKEEKET